MVKQVNHALVVVILLTAVLAVRSAAAGGEQGAAPQPKAQTEAKPMPHDHAAPMQHDHAAMLAAEMMREPHHMLAMAYRTNLQTFATMLRDQANNGDGFDRDFAGIAVAEMRRSLDEMQKHHLEHVESMDDDAKTTMAASMRHMDEHRTAIEEHLVALEAEVAKDAPDSRSMVQHAQEMLANCKGMSKGMASAAESKTD